METKDMFKVVVVGEQNVGKTAFIKQLMSSTLSSTSSNRPQHEDERYTCTVTVDQKDSLLVVADAGHNPSDKQLGGSTSTLPSAYAIVYNITSPKTFGKVVNYKERIDSVIKANDVTNPRMFNRRSLSASDSLITAPPSPPPPKAPLVILVGTHLDKDHHRSVPYSEAYSMAKTFNAVFAEISSKTGDNVAALCEEIVRQLRHRTNTTSASKKGGMMDKIKAHKKEKPKRLKRNDSIVQMLKFIHNMSTDQQQDSPVVQQPLTSSTPTDPSSLSQGNPAQNEQPSAVGGRERKAALKWDQSTSAVVNWNEVEKEFPVVSSVIDPKQAAKNGFSVELGHRGLSTTTTTTATSNDSASFTIMDGDRDVAWYKEYMQPREHKNYLAKTASLGPVAISVAGHSPGHRTKVIVRTKHGWDRMYVPPNLTSEKEILKYVQTHHSKLAVFDSVHVVTCKQGEDNSLKLTAIHGDADLLLQGQLIEMEEKEIKRYSRYKFGILYATDDQTTEDEMFSNVEGSVQFQSFLHFLATRVTLLHFRGYAENTTGTHSFYTKHHGVEIMFHVSTELPFQPDDLQRVERKRHLGNDVVMLVYKEGDKKPFDPTRIHSQFNHVFIVVQPEKSKTNSSGLPCYRVGVVCKSGVVPFAPFIGQANLPAAGDTVIFEQNSFFRNFLLTKLVNAERAALYSNEFKAKLMTTRRLLLEELADKFLDSNGSQKNLKDKEARRHSVYAPSQQQFQQLQQSNSASDAAAGLTEDMEEVADMGKKMLVCCSQEPRLFDPGTLKDLLQRLLYWSLSTSITKQRVHSSAPSSMSSASTSPASVSSRWSSQHQDNVIARAKHVVKAGNHFKDIQASRKAQGGSENSAQADEALAQLKLALYDFYLELKETTSTSSLDNLMQQQGTANDNNNNNNNNNNSNNRTKVTKSTSNDSLTPPSAPLISLVVSKVQGGTNHTPDSSNNSETYGELGRRRSKSESRAKAQSVVLSQNSKDLTVEAVVSENTSPNNNNNNNNSPNKHSNKNADIQSVVKSVEGKFEEVFNYLAGPNFTETSLVQLLIGLVRKIKTFASLVGEEECSELLHTTKYLLQKGIVLKQSSFNEDVYKAEAHEAVQQLAAIFATTSHAQQLNTTTT